MNDTTFGYTMKQLEKGETIYVTLQPKDITGRITSYNKRHSTNIKVKTTSCYCIEKESGKQETITKITKV